MTHEFKIGDLVKYVITVGDHDIPAEGYVIGHAPNSYAPASGQIHPVIATDAWHSKDAEPEVLTLLSTGHTETAHRLREQYLSDPLSGLLPISEAPAPVTASSVRTR